MVSGYGLKTEIEEIRNLLNAGIADMGSSDFNFNILLYISTRMDTLIVEYMKNEVD